MTLARARLLTGLCIGCAASWAHAAVSVEGVDERLRGNVLAYVDLDEEPCDAPAWRVRQRFQAAPERIRSALQAFGYYDVEIASTLDVADACWSARFDVELGEPVLIRRISLELHGEARNDPPFLRTIESSTLRVGEPLDHGAYERLKQRLLDLAQERGYPAAAFSVSRLDVYPREHAADITLRFDSGARYRFGSIDLHQDILSDRLIRSYFNFETGDPYDNRQLTALYVDLTDSGFFNVITVRPLPPVHERQEIPVEISLTPGTRRLLTYGMGFSTDTGPRLRFGRTNRRRNAQGHQFGVNAQLSPVVSEVTLNYRFPYGDPRSEWVSVDAGVKRENTETVESESLEFGARRVVQRPGNWARTQFLNLLIEDFEVGDQVGRSSLLVPGMEWTRTRADNTLRPRAGSRLDLEIRGAGDALGSDTSFLQARAEGKWIRSFPSSARFIVRSHIGLTVNDELQSLPPSVRFFAGGDSSVRGYKFESLGPQDESGQVIGGSHLVVASIEYEHPIRERWSLAVFVDSGNAFEGSDLEPKSGAGLGIRWQSPLGPIRADVAFPLNNGDRSARLHISLGPDL